MVRVGVVGVTGSGAAATDAAEDSQGEVEGVFSVELVGVDSLEVVAALRRLTTRCFFFRLNGVLPPARGVPVAEPNVVTLAAEVEADKLGLLAWPDGVVVPDAILLMSAFSSVGSIPFGSRKSSAGRSQIV